MKLFLTYLALLILSIQLYAQSLKQFDTIPTTSLVYKETNEIILNKENILATISIKHDSLFICKGESSSLKLIRFNKSKSRVAEIGINASDAKSLNLYGKLRDLKYSVVIDSLGTSAPHLILHWSSVGVWTSGVCFGNSGYTTNVTTKKRNGFTVINLVNNTIIFRGLTSYSTDNTNIREGGLGGSCSRVKLNLDNNLLTIRHSSHGIDSIATIGNECQTSNHLYFYNYDIKETKNYKLVNGVFVVIN